MKPPRPVDLPIVLRIFREVPELARAGALGGANALYLEHLENPCGRFSFDLDLQNQTDEIETIHRRFPPQARGKLHLVSRLNSEMYEYEARIGAHVVRVELARPFLRHRKKYQPSRHVPGLEVVSLSDLIFAKVSAFSTRGFGRDLLDLFAVDQQRKVDWRKLLIQAARASDNDYNPTEFHRKLKQHHRDCSKTEYLEELPATNPPSASVLRLFINRLLAANQIVTRDTLE